MEEIIDPIDWNIIKSELKKEFFIRKSKKGNFDIYIVNGAQCPQVMKEIGRLREIAFRDAGGGTKQALDIDDFDVQSPLYKQLILIDWEDEEIVGGYRFIDCNEAHDIEKDRFRLSTSHYFHFSDDFKNDYLKHTIELGRSWIQPMYQFRGNARKGLFALSSLWDGLGSLLGIYPEAKYFFGKVTMYPHYNSKARDFLLYFLNYYFPDKDSLVSPKYPVQINLAKSEFLEIFDSLEYTQGLQTLKAKLMDLGERVPPLINLYMGLSTSMKCFGTAINPEFGGVEETGILVTIADIYPEKRKRHT